MSKIKFKKRPFPVEEQLKLLEKRNLTIKNKTKAIRYLENIGYYHLSVYFRPYYQNGDIFKKNTTFQEIIDTYSFDRELKFLVFNHIERIEISVRSHFLNYMCNKYNSSHWQDNEGIFKNLIKKMRMKSFNLL